MIRLRNVSVTVALHRFGTFLSFARTRLETFLERFSGMLVGVMNKSVVWNENSTKGEELVDINEFQIVTIANEDLSPEQHKALFEVLLPHCFPSVSPQEIAEDHSVEPVAYMLCYYKGEIVGCASAYIREIEYNGQRQRLRLGGVSIVCIRTDMRSQGIATRVCTVIMQFLTEAQCDVAFLATSEMARHLYEKLGFRPLKLFSWENIHGQVKTGDNGMLAALCNPAVAETIWQTGQVFHVGKGYW